LPVFKEWGPVGIAELRPCHCCRDLCSRSSTSFGIFFNENDLFLPWGETQGDQLLNNFFLPQDQIFVMVGSSSTSLKF